MKNLKVKTGKIIPQDSYIDSQKDFDSLLKTIDQTKIKKTTKSNWGLDVLCIIGLASLTYAFYFTDSGNLPPAIYSNNSTQKTTIIEVASEKILQNKNETPIVTLLENESTVNNKFLEKNDSVPHKNNSVIVSETKKDAIILTENLIDSTVAVASVETTIIDSAEIKNNESINKTEQSIHNNINFLKQNGDSIVKAADEIVWYGLDFSKAVFIGSFGQGPGLPDATGADMKNKWIPIWNALVQYEKENFNIEKTYNKKNVIVDFASVNAVNKEIDAVNCISFNEINVKKAGIDELLNKYTNETKKEGIGLVYLVESFNKWTETGIVYTVFFDIKTKTPLKVNRYEGAAIGWGLKNHWAGVIKNIIKSVEAERIMEERTNKKAKK